MKSKWSWVVALILACCIMPMTSCGQGIYRYGAGSVGKACIYELARIGWIEGKTAAKWVNKLGVQDAD